MKINRGLNKKASAFCAFAVQTGRGAAILAAAFAAIAAVLGSSSAASAREDANDAAANADGVEYWVGDGYPLLYSKDGGAIEAVWDAEEKNALPVFADAVYLQLRKQGKLYKGKRLKIKGRLLRAVYVETNADPREGYYDLWILLPDAKRDPIRAIAKRAPDGFALDERLENEQAYAQDVRYRDETIETTAVYYRTTAYDAGDDLYAAPTFIALDFTTAGGSSANSRSEPTNQAESKSAAATIRTTLAVVLIALWFFTRRFVKTLKRGKKDLKRASLPKRLGKFMWALAALGTLSAGTTIFANEPQTVASNELQDDEFWSIAVGASEEEWARESTQTRPALTDGTNGAAEIGSAAEFTRRREIALSALERLSGLLTLAAIKERANADFQQTTLGEYVADRDRVDYFTTDGASGVVGYYYGRLCAWSAIGLTPIEQERSGLEAVYRGVVESDRGRRFVVYCAQKPPQNAEKVGGYAIRFGQEKNADEDASAEEATALLSPKMGAYDDSNALSASGVDLSSYDAVPVFPANAANTSDKEKLKRVFAAMRWTRADREPFYETLGAVGRMKRGADATAASDDVVGLFNRPEQQRGRRFKLRGWARRVNMILVDDPEARAIYGADRYYQIFMYANDSQGYPIVVCTPRLPKELKVGGGAEYRRELEIVGYFYKTWAYERVGTVTTADGGADEGSNEDKEKTPTQNWTRSPVLIGIAEKVWPEEEKNGAPPVAPRTIVVGFAILAIAWIALRRISRR